MTVEDRKVHGQQPDVVGRYCRRVICEQFVADGITEATANVTYLNVNGNWHRLVVDHPAIFWRTQLEEPRPWAVPEKNWVYPHVDIRESGDLHSIDVDSNQSSTRVSIVFASGRRVVIEGTHTRSDYFVVQGQPLADPCE